MTLPVDEQAIERFRRLIEDRLGLQYDPSKLEELADVLRRRIALTGRELQSYLEDLASPVAGRDELRAIAEDLTIGETYFFRNPNHFRAAVEVAVPDRMRRAARAGRPLRILSAACASGEEAYTLAIILREQFPHWTSRDVTILGVDVNGRFLEKARLGIYSPWSLRAMPAGGQDRWFGSREATFVLDEGIRSLVTFEERNLGVEDPDFWREDSFDIIFCRNVLIYFPTQLVRVVVARLASSLAPGGFLFLGDAESLRGISQDFHLCHSHDTFYYQRREPGSGHRPSPPASAIVSSGTGPAVPGPRLADAGASWAAAIHRSTERIDALMQAPASVRPPSEPDPAPSVSLDPSAEVELERASTLTQQGRVLEARELCRRVLERDEFNAGAHYLMALCCEHVADLTAARRHDQIAVYLDGTFAMPHLHLGLLAKRAGDSEGARRELVRARDLLDQEDASRILLFGGGFGREALLKVCQAELRADRAR